VSRWSLSGNSFFCRFGNESVWSIGRIWIKLHAFFIKHFRLNASAGHVLLPLLLLRAQAFDLLSDLIGVLFPDRQTRIVNSPRRCSQPSNFNVSFGIYLPCFAPGRTLLQGSVTWLVLVRRFSQLPPVFWGCAFLCSCDEAGRFDVQTKTPRSKRKSRALLYRTKNRDEEGRGNATDVSSWKRGERFCFADGCLAVLSLCSSHVRQRWRVEQHGFLS